MWARHGMAPVASVGERSASRSVQATMCVVRLTHTTARLVADATIVCADARQQQHLSGQHRCCERVQRDRIECEEWLSVRALLAHADSPNDKFPGRRRV